MVPELSLVDINQHRRHRKIHRGDRTEAHLVELHEAFAQPVHFLPVNCALSAVACKGVRGGGKGEGRSSQLVPWTRLSRTILVVLPISPGSQGIQGSEKSIVDDARASRDRTKDGARARVALVSLDLRLSNGAGGLRQMGKPPLRRDELAVAWMR